MLGEGEDERSFTVDTKGCYRVYSVMGAAAYMNEDVAYGARVGSSRAHRRAGSISELECGIDYAFVDLPSSIKVKTGSPDFRSLGWLHDDGDGGWVVAVNSLLDDTGEFKSQSRGAAQRIVRAVVTHDPNNPALPAITQRLQQLGLQVPVATPGNLLAGMIRRPKKKE